MKTIHSALSCIAILWQCLTCSHSYALSPAPAIRNALTQAVCADFRPGSDEVTQDTSLAITKLLSLHPSDYKADIIVFPSAAYSKKYFIPTGRDVVRNNTALTTLRLSTLAKTAFPQSYSLKFSVSYFGDDRDWRYRFWGNSCGDDSFVVLFTDSIPSYSMPQMCLIGNNETKDCEIFCTSDACSKFNYVQKRVYP